MASFVISAAAVFLCSVLAVSGILSAAEATDAAERQMPEMKGPVGMMKLNRQFAGNIHPNTDDAMSLRPVNRQCGRSKYPDACDMELPAPRIVGGQEARESELPWQVSFRHLGRHFCGGSIVAPSWIVTAAHCFTWLPLQDAVKTVTAAVGEHTRNATSSVRKVLRILNVIKGDYDSQTGVNDIALVRIRGRIRFSRNVAPICLPASTSFFDFKKCVVSGWGALEWGGSVVETLQYATLNVTTNVLCNSTFQDTPYQIYDDMMCATDNEGDATRDTCQGDSGGPLALKGNDGRFTLAGITSWGIGCASGYPGVYTRVSRYVNFICKITGIRCTAN